jgi:hypothetical protein
VALTVILVVAMLKQRKGFRPRRKTALGSGAEMVVWAWRVKSVAVAAVVAGGCGVACMAVCRWQAVAVWRSHGDGSRLRSAPHRLRAWIPVKRPISHSHAVSRRLLDRGSAGPSPIWDSLRTVSQSSPRAHSVLTHRIWATRTGFRDSVIPVGLRFLWVCVCAPHGWNLTESGSCLILPS